MTEKIEMKNMSITKINESETETETGTKTVWTYTLTNEDAGEQFTLKTASDQHLRIGQKFNMAMTNPQTQLPLEEPEPPKEELKEPEAVPEKAKKTLSKKEKEILEEAESLIKKADKIIEEKKQTKTSCKYYYRGGLCANSKLDKPFCPGLDKCPLDQEQPTEKKPEAPQSKLPGIDPQGEISRDNFLGTTYEYPTTHKGEEVVQTIGVIDIGGSYMTAWKSKSGGYHRIKSKALDPRDTLELAQQDLDEFAKKKKLKAVGGAEAPEDETEEPHQVTLLLKKEKFPKDILGGLKEDIMIEKNAAGNFFYAHARSKEGADSFETNKAFTDELKKITGLNWTWVSGNLFNADRKQLNETKEE